MKNKLVFILFFLFLGSLSSIYFGEAEKLKEEAGKKGILKNSVQSTNSWLDRFYIGAVHSGIDCSYRFANLDTLGFKIFHLYILGHEYDLIQKKYYPHMFWGNCASIPNDKLLTPVSQYSLGVNSLLDSVHSEQPEMRVVMMRPKIEYLCFGQRSDYQCEEVPETDDLWFYAFNEHNTGVTETDVSIWGGDSVKAIHCRTLPSNTQRDNPGFVVRRLRANTEQSNMMLSGGNEWQGDSYCKWLIKPRIRIPVNFPYTNPNDTVCRIIVIEQNGTDTLLNVEILAREFFDEGDIYEGNYKEKFRLTGGKKLEIDRDTNHWGDRWIYKARDTRPYDDDISLNKADIQIYWYGNCDMWIDYVRVDNDVADRLLKEPNGDIEFNKWLEDEVTEIGNHYSNGEQIFMKYYLECYQFNNTPCISYVNSKLKQYSNGRLDLIQDLTNTLSNHVGWKNRMRLENPYFIKKYYIDRIGFTQIFAESYPFTGCYETYQNFSRIPNTLPIHSHDSVIAQSISPTEYDNWLQDNLNHYPYQLEGDDSEQPKCNNSGLRQDRGNFRFRLQLGDSLSKLADIPFIFMPQAHQWYRPGEVRREPTNEELNMMINTSLCYGVKGILYFSYNSVTDPGTNTYGIGIADVNGELRRQNFYGQTNPDKVQTLQSITERVSGKWGSYLQKFDNTNRKNAIYNFEYQRQNFLSNTYFSEISTYPPITSDLEVESSIPDNPQYTYIQAAVFKNPQESNKHYFMIVNRRCAPYNSFENENGGRRKVKIKFDADSSEFLNFKKWVIVDLFNNTRVAVFDKTAGSQIDLGWYLPGEGKLYTILPEM